MSLKGELVKEVNHRLREGWECLNRGSRADREEGTWKTTGGLSSWAVRREGCKPHHLYICALDAVTRNHQSSSRWLVWAIATFSPGSPCDQWKALVKLYLTGGHVWTWAIWGSSSQPWPCWHCDLSVGPCSPCWHCDLSVGPCSLGQKCLSFVKDKLDTR